MASLSSGSGDVQRGIISANNQDYTSVTAVNPHVLIDDAYAYEGGFRGGAYLIPHPLEGHYNERKDFSYYVNFFQPIIDAMVRPVFDRGVKRDSTSDAYNLFADNCDNRGTSLTRFMLDAATECRKHSTVFVVMDNVPAEQMPDTAAGAIEARAIPYVYMVKPQDVTEQYCALDRFGRLMEFTFCSGIYLDGKEEREKYTTITDEMVVEWYIDARDSRQYIGEPRLHGLGFLPVVAMRDKLPSVKRVIAEPKTYGLVRVCHAVYNKDSEMRELERKQEFALLCLQAGPADDLAIGAGAALTVPLEAKMMPSYISPDPNTLLALLKTREELRADLYRLAEQNGVVGVQSQQSGVAMAYSFKAHSSVLSETANICETAEDTLATMFFAFVNERGEAEIEYAHDYGVYDAVEAQRWVQMVLDAQPTENVRNYILKKLLRKAFPQEDEIEIDELDSAIDADVRDEALDAEESADNGSE